MNKDIYFNYLKPLIQNSSVKILRLLTFVSLVATGLVYTNFSNSNPVDSSNVQTIVLDPGHGGKDPGAIGSISYEKDINLQVCLKLGNILQKKYPKKTILYTRKEDSYPSLKSRHAYANQNKGDLFLSVHVNSTSGSYKKIKTSSGRYKTIKVRTTERSGTESYVLGLHRNDQKEGAIKENSDKIMDENGLLNPNDPMTNIIIAQYSQAYLARSILLGTRIEEEFTRQGRRSEGVKQKGLEVLAGSAMPGVLVEIGFINNPSDEVYLTSDNGQWEVAGALYRGIEQYIKEIDYKK